MSQQQVSQQQVSPAHGPIEVGLLGPCTMRVDGAELTLPARKERMVLASLALRPGRPVSVHELAVVLWGEPLPAAARKSAQAVASRLRRRMGEQVPGLETMVRTDDDGYTLLIHPGGVDAVLFERQVSQAAEALERSDANGSAALLAEALAGWRGDPVPELEDSALGQIEAVRLSELRLVALERWNDADLALGRLDAVVRRSEGLVAEAPYREGVWAQLMTALYRSGRQAESLRAYQRARSCLVDELGIEPGPHLRDLEAAIVGQDPNLEVPVPANEASPVVAAPGVRSSAGRAVSTPAPAEGGADTLGGADRAGGGPDRRESAWISGICQGPFVDRHVETDHLDRVFRAVTAGTSVVVISGDDGVGKTRLVAEAARRFAREGSVVLAGRCHGERATLGPIREMVDRAAGEGIVDSDTLPVATAATLGALSAVVADRAGVAGDPGFDDPYAAATAIRSLARVAGAGGASPPGVVVVDDLHAADATTLETVRHLVGALTGAPLLVVLIVRPSGARARTEVLDLLDDLHCHPAYQRIALGPLDPHHGALFLAELLDVRSDGAGGVSDGTRPEVLRRLSDEVGGTPRFLHAVAAAVEAGRVGAGVDWLPGSLHELGLPKSVQDLVRRKLRSFPADQLRLLAVATALGDRFSVSGVAEATGSRPDVVMDALDLFRAAGVVRLMGDGEAEFVCDAVRRVVHADFLPLCRRVPGGLPMGALERHLALVPGT